MILLAMAVAGCSWVQPRGNPAHTGADLAIGVTATSLADLEPAWTTADHAALAEEVVALAGTTTGDLVAWKISGCGASTCPVTWSRAQGAPVGPVTPIDHALLCSRWAARSGSSSSRPVQTRTAPMIVGIASR